MDVRIPVPNRYFGAFEDGALKVRGIEMRRHDTPRFIADMQQYVLEQLAGAADMDTCLAQVIASIRGRLAALRARQIDPSTLLVSQILSRPLEEYAVSSPTASAAKQLHEAGKLRFPGQRIQFIWTIGEPGVFAWDLPERLDPARIDAARYTELSLRAMSTILQPWGIQQEWLAESVLHDWHQACLPDCLGPEGKLIMAAQGKDALT